MALLSGIGLCRVTQYMWLSMPHFVFCFFHLSAFRLVLSSLAFCSWISKLAFSLLFEKKKSKALGTFVNKVQGIKNGSTKFTASAAEGSRILPSKNRDAEFQLCIDAGRYDESTKKLNVVLQVNSQAKSPALRDWVKKNSTHGQLATTSFDTSADGKDAELNKVLSALQNQAKQKLG